MDERVRQLREIANRLYILGDIVSPGQYQVVKECYLKLMDVIKEMEHEN